MEREVKSDEQYGESVTCKLQLTSRVLLNLRDTLRALKEVYPNGRRVGVVTRRRRIRQALAGWIVLVRLICSVC